MSLKRHQPKADARSNQVPPNIPREIRPEPGSLRHLIITNPRRRLYTRPELWTQEHLQMLQCECSTIPVEESFRQGGESGIEWLRGYSDFDDALAYIERYKSNYKDDNRVFYLFQRLVTLVVQASDKYKFVCDYEAGITYKGVPLFFGQKEVARVHCRVLAMDKLQLLPVCAYIDNRWMQGPARKDYFRGRAHLKKKMMRIMGAKRSALQPIPDSPIDPYFVALLIAMAQGNISLQKEKEPRTVYLFYPSKCRKIINLYTAVVTSEFLRKFDYPYQQSDAGLSITIQHLPLDPCTSFVNALYNIVGDFIEPRPRTNDVEHTGEQPEDIHNDQINTLTRKPSRKAAKKPTRPRSKSKPVSKSTKRSSISKKRKS